MPMSIPGPPPEARFAVRPHGGGPTETTERNAHMGLDMYLTGEKFVMATGLQEDGFPLR